MNLQEFSEELAGCLAPAAFMMKPSDDLDMSKEEEESNVLSGYFAYTFAQFSGDLMAGPPPPAMAADLLKREAENAPSIAEEIKNEDLDTFRETAEKAQEERKEEIAE